MSDWADMACNEYERTHRAPEMQAEDKEAHDTLRAIICDGARAAGCVVERINYCRCPENGWSDTYDIRRDGRRIVVRIKTSEGERPRARIYDFATRKWLRSDLDECETDDDVAVQVVEACAEATA